MAPTAERIEASQRLDSRGIPTIQVRLKVGETLVTALVPSGASTGSKEALELRDGDQNRYLGKGVLKAIDNIQNEIVPAIADLDVVEDQGKIDRTMMELDGTEDKSRLGANAILAVSMAVARAGAEARGIPLFEHLADINGEKNPNLLPTPMMNVISGGAHANNGIPFQEFMVVPVGARSFKEAIRMSAETYHYLGTLLDKPGLGDEGGYAPMLQQGDGGTERGRIYLAIDKLQKAIRAAGYDPLRDIKIALDIAANEFSTDEGEYTLDIPFNSERLISFYEGLAIGYPIISIEDGLREDDPEWINLTNVLNKRRIQIVGDDRFVTNPRIFSEGIQAGVANSILVKLNQIGTVTQTLEVIRMAQAAGYNVIISHRSGETEDTFIADLAVGTRSGQIKTGAPARGERTAKYNRLLDIEQYDLPRMGLTPEYAGVAPFQR